MKKLSIFLIIIGAFLSAFGSYVIYIDKHQYWESLYIGIVIILVGLIIFSVHKSNKTSKSSKPLFIIISCFLSLGLAISLLILSSTIKANKNQTLIKGIQENLVVSKEIGGLDYIVIAYPSRGSGRRRNRQKVISNVYLLKGQDKYATIRTYEVKTENNSYLLDTLIRVYSLNPDDIPFETSKAVENRIFKDK